MQTNLIERMENLMSALEEAQHWHVYNYTSDTAYVWQYRVYFENWS